MFETYFQKQALRMKRRRFLQSSAAAAGVATLGAPRLAHAQEEDPRFFFIVGANGGGSIIDSFLPTAENESANGSTLVTYPALLVAQPGGSNLRCVHSPLPIPGFPALRQQEFLSKHAADTVVMTVEGTSVNHIVGSKRFLTGAGADRGRTILEANAERRGGDLLVPNVNMGESGYLEPGEDSTLAPWARAEPVADAALFSIATDGARGITHAPARPLIERARIVREQLEDQSVFAQTFRTSPTLVRYLRNRRGVNRAMEAADLITKLMLYPHSGATPINDYDLEQSPEGQTLLGSFPNFTTDPFEAQAALAFLLARYRISTSILISPSFTPLLTGSTLENTPLAFDFSHGQHALAQQSMWSRCLGVASDLIDLLKQTPLDDNNPGAGTMWDKSVVYFATEFGRTKTRPSGAQDFGTGHHLNNGVIMVSPLLNGNRVYGGVDPDTVLTYGFDRTTGDPAPGTVMREADVYSVLCSLLDITYDGQVPIPAMLA